MSELKGVSRNAAVVILAAGKGTRMGRADLAKVCFEIDGRPAINRIIETFKKLKFSKFVVVVGALAQQVMETVGRDHPEVTFVFQSRQLGTGHAVAPASQALQILGHSHPVLVTMGDKFIEPEAVQILVEGFIRQRADFALLTIPRTRASEASGGRVLLDRKGQAVAIVEKADISRQAIADEIRGLLKRGRRIGPEALTRIASRLLPQPKKQATAIPELLSLASRGTVDPARLRKILQSRKYNLSLAGKKYTSQEIERACKGINPSLYLFQPDAFYQAVSMLTNDNAQGEYYLTDAVMHLAGVTDADGHPRYRIRAIPAGNPKLIQGFNSPDELLAIQDHLRRKKARPRSPGTAGRPRLKKSQYSSVRSWIEKIKRLDPSQKRRLADIYGPHEDLHQEKRKSLLKVLTCYGKRFGFDDRVVIVRAPGRINLMGRHVDHRGGHNNFLAIHRETLAVAGLRDDDSVVAINVEPRKFETVEFNISDLIGRFAWSDWVNFVNSDWVRNLLRSTAGNWGNYIKAAMLRLQHHYQDLKVRGANIALYGDVPIAAGLSSSSTIVVAILQAAIALNELDLTSQQFIDLCGEGEWFVGSRGGAGDHAAIYLGQRGKIAHVGYLPFRVEKLIDAPAGYRIMIADSHIKAAKSSASRNMFNARIAAYNLGFALLRQRCPDYAASLEHVRDIDPEKLGCSTSSIYRMLLKVPQFLTRRELQSLLPSDCLPLVKANFSTHDEPPGYNIRGVLLFGAAESLRSKTCMDLLEKGCIGQFGELMKISHEGDRVSAAGDDGRYRMLGDPCTDEHLQELIASLASEDPGRVLRAQLYMQPGSYACSTVEIDRMADIACSVEGVVGAQIAGAGLGGCIMILVKKEALERVRKALIRRYYQPAGLEPAILTCRTVKGAGLLEF